MRFLDCCTAADQRLEDMMKRYNARLSLVLAVLFVLVLSACSSSGKTTSASSGGPSSSAAKAYVAKAKAFVAAHLKEAPFSAGKAYKPPPGKTIGIVASAQSDPIDVQIVAAAQQAAKVVGWKTVVIDGKGSPSDWNIAIQQFVQQKVDGIFDVAIPDNAVPQALAAASAVNIPVISIGAGTLASKPVAHPSFASVDLPYAFMGQMEGYSMVAASNGTAKAAFMTSHLVPSVNQLIISSEDILKQCAGCKVLDTTEIDLNSNVTPAVATQTQSLLSQFGKGQIGYIVPPLDFMTEGATQALTAAGRTDVKLLTNACTPGVTPGLDQIRKGGPTIFCNTPDHAWYGWAAVDQMGRRLAGLPTSNFLLPLPFWNTSNLTSATPNTPSTYSPFDFKSYYEKLWGVKQ
jgi:ribose transport system substrate-binding protein